MANEAPFINETMPPSAGAEDAPASSKAAESEVRAEASANDALVIQTPAAKESAETSASTAKLAYLTILNPDGSAGKSLMAKEVLEERQAVVNNMSKRVNTFLEKMQKDCKFLEKNVKVSLSFSCSSLH
jgi:hypothetical protein